MRLATIAEYHDSLKKTYGTMRWFVDLFLPGEFRRRMFVCFGYTFLARMLSLLLPGGPGLLIYFLKDHKIWLAYITVLGLFLIGSVADFINKNGGKLQDQLMADFQIEADHLINSRFFEKDVGTHILQSKLLSASRTEHARSAVRAVKNLWFLSGTEAVGTFLVSVVFVILLSPVAGLIVLLLIAMNIVLSIHLNLFLQNTLKPIENERGLMKAFTDQKRVMYRRVKVHAKEQEELTNLYGCWTNIGQRERTVWSVYLDLTYARSTLVNIATAGVGFYAIYSFSHGWSYAEEIIPLITWTGMATQQIRLLARLQRELDEHIPTLQSLKEAMELPVIIREAPDAVLCPDGALTIRFEHVTFGYTADRLVLKDVSFVLKPGEKASLVGPSGAGKSTIAELLLRFYDPSSGRITVNGIDLRKIVLSSWYKRIGYIPQRAEIFDGTLRENVLYRFSKEEQAKISDAYIMAHFVRMGVDLSDRMTHGLDTVVGDRGLKLSPGQLQRLMIVAVTMPDADGKTPDFYLIDEATSSLDAEAQAYVQEGLDRLTQGATGSLTIAHRLSAVEGAQHYLSLRKLSEVVGDMSQIEADTDSMGRLAELSLRFAQNAKREGVVIQ